jgi:hypothetical protein
VRPECQIFDMAMRDGLTMEAWLDTPSALAAKNLAARLQKNPQGAQGYRLEVTK